MPSNSNLFISSISAQHLAIPPAASYSSARETSDLFEDVKESRRLMLLPFCNFRMHVRFSRLFSALWNKRPENCSSTISGGKEAWEEKERKPIACVDFSWRLCSGDAFCMHVWRCPEIEKRFAQFCLTGQNQLNRKSAWPPPPHAPFIWQVWKLDLMKRAPSNARKTKSMKRERNGLR